MTLILSTQRNGDNTGVRAYCDTLEHVLRDKGVEVKRITHHECSPRCVWLWRQILHIARLFGRGAQQVVMRVATYYMTKSALGKFKVQSDETSDKQLRILAQDPITAAAAAAVFGPNLQTSNPPIIHCTCHFSDPIEEIFRAVPMGPISRWLMRRVMGYYLCKNKRYFVLTKSVAEVMRNYAPEAVIKVIPTMCKVKEYTERIPHDGFRIVMAGRLEYLKGQWRLVEMLAELPEAELWLLGDGSERGKLEEQAAKNGVATRVKFLGFRSDAVEMFRQCDLYVHSSLMESLPLSPIEAIFAGIPAMSFEYPGWNDWEIYDGIPPPTAASIREIMVKYPYLKDEMLARQRSKASVFRPDEAVCVYLS